jgi:acetoin utilization protein AcuB
MLVRDFMSPVASVRPDSNAATASALLSAGHLHHLVVADHGSVVGVVSDRDLALADSGSRVDAVMWRRVPTVDPSSPLLDAARKLNGLDTECVVVLDGNALAGCVTLSDVVRALA